MKWSILNINSKYKTSIILIYDFIAITISFFLALYLRLGQSPLQKHSIEEIAYPFIFLAITQSATLYFFGTYRAIWGFSSTKDLAKLMKASLTAVSVSFCVMFFYNRLGSIPRTVFFIDWLLLIISLGGGRFGYRMIKEHHKSRNLQGDKKNTLIIGAGEAGERLFRDINYNNELKTKVVCFVDDDKRKWRKKIHDTLIAGPIESLEKYVEEYSIHQIFIAIPSLTKNRMKEIVDTCRKLKIEFKTLPHINDILNYKISYRQLRDVQPVDLLGRKEIKLDTELIENIIKDKIVLVTGAGGSIGSELCRQILTFKPKQLILVDSSEYLLYRIDLDLKNDITNIPIFPVIGDIRFKNKLDIIFSHYSPEVVFHAAAYKHVPLMELNPKEALHTNVIGTRNLVEITQKYNVPRFIMISTDKAVNPTNIMGTSKRIAEMICQSYEKTPNSTKFMTVRFGNVLGSSGSVVPLFQEQINRGGPVTVTHRDVKRYFMSIPEAVQLVLEAAAIGDGSEIFVLDMGEQIKIIDLAVNIIELSGFTVDEIGIEFTGLRPGEKLYEELLSHDETHLTTRHPLVKVAQSRKINNDFDNLINQIEILIDKEIKNEELIKVANQLVPEFTPDTKVETKPINHENIH